MPACSKVHVRPLLTNPVTSHVTGLRICFEAYCKSEEYRRALLLTCYSILMMYVT